MFRPNIRSSSGLRQTKSLLLSVHWDNNMSDSRKSTQNLVSGMDKGIPFRSQAESQGGRTTIWRRLTSGAPQGSVLGPLLFLAYVDDIWRNMESTIRLFADDCVIYRKIINNTDMEKLQKDLDRLGEWAVENAMKINPSKSKAIRFTRTRVKYPLNYSLMDTLIP